jgi:CHAD domain-containing protein
MAYRLIQDEALARGLRRIAREEIDSAIEYLGTTDPAKLDDAVHEARKCIKRLRGFMRILAAAENDVAVLGALGRTLSELRDAAAMVETVDLLARQTRDAAVLETLAGLRRTLQTRAREKLAGAEVRGVLENAAAGLREVKRRVGGWTLANSFDTLAPGLRRTWRRGRNALRRVREERSAENFHSLRKRAKDRWYQVKLLEALWSPVGYSPEKPLRSLQEDLGDDHNLELLRAVLPPGSDAVLAAVNALQQQLRRKSLEAASELYAGKAGDFEKEMRSLWERWRVAVPDRAAAKPSRAPAVRTRSQA